MSEDFLSLTLGFTLKADMNILVSKLTSAGLDAVDKLMKLNSKTLGFLPKEALQDFLNKGGALGAIGNDGQLVGYLLYSAYTNYFRITHLCVVERYRGKGIAAQLVNCLREEAGTQKIIKLNCRRDFPANDMWPKLGFVARHEKPSRSKNNHRLTTWELILAQEEQLEIFQARTSDDTVDIIIDAQIFFDFDEPDSDKTAPSKALLSDFLVDSLSLWITDELFNEIDRQDDPQLRKISRNRAHNFPQIKSLVHLTEDISELLNGILPRGTRSRDSDIQHLAKAAASNVNTFVTRDQALLKKSKEIVELTGLDVISPIDLIIRMHELSERQSYTPDRIAGLHLRWQRMKSNDLPSFPLASFIEKHETTGRFREKLESFLAKPERYECELLWSGNEITAMRVLTKSFKKRLSSPLARVARSTDKSLFERFLIADTIAKAVKEHLDMVRFEVSSLTPSLIPDLLEMGFVKCDNGLVRFCFSRCQSREEVFSAIAALCPECLTSYQCMLDLDLEQCCSPLSLKPAPQRLFLIPIQAGYAISLIDRLASADDLFGGNPEVLLLWNNVYYRSATCHKMLKVPARILWYVSRNKHEIIAVSRLDDVVIDTPMELFRKFKKFGILKWNDLYEMCNHNPSKKLMALRFSHTFLFRRPVSLDEVKNVFKKYNKARPSLQGPSILPAKIFRELFQRGFPNRS